VIHVILFQGKSEARIPKSETNENAQIEPRNSSGFTKVHASSYRTWQNTKMAHHHQGAHNYLYLTMRTNILRVFFMPKRRF